MRRRSSTKQLKQTDRLSPELRVWHDRIFEGFKELKTQFKRVSTLSLLNMVLQKGQRAEVIIC